MAYDYFPGADTLEERFLRASPQGQVPIPEDVMWSITVQIASALRAIHSAGLSCRVFPSKVLISGQSRVRINWIGIEELLNWDLASKKNIAQARVRRVNDIDYFLNRQLSSLIGRRFEVFWQAALSTVS